MKTELFQHTIRLADDHLVLGQRLGEWCGHAPTLEEDLGLANIGLDMIGQARALYAYASVVEGSGRDEDELAFVRREKEYENCLLVEQPNGDFAATMLRQLFFSAYMLPYWEAKCTSSDETLAGIAGKAVKEAAYHVRHSAEWVIRLGDGTSESHRRMTAAVNMLWPYTGELFESDAISKRMIEAGIAPDPALIEPAWDETIGRIFTEAGLKAPDKKGGTSGGRNGRHSEHMGHLLAELQFMQRSYPGLQW